MKKHTTIKITRRFLEENLHACASGVEAVRHLLPCTISTDPERNLPLALDLVKIEEGWRLDWLGDATIGWNVIMNEGRALYDEFDPITVWENEPYIVAQFLAMIADGPQ